MVPAAISTLAPTAAVAIAIYISPRGFTWEKETVSAKCVPGLNILSKHILAEPRMRMFLLSFQWAKYCVIEYKTWAHYNKTSGRVKIHT